MADTIFAQSTPLVRSAIAIFRISGPLSSDIGYTLTGKSLRPRCAEYVRISHPISGAIIDFCLALWFPGPNSFTGEDLLELQTHGGFAVCREVYSALAQFPGVRMAEPGEFTRRAFNNGKIDLSSTEALADLINADTQQQHRQAMHRMIGGFVDYFHEWRQEIVGARSLIEASIDFSDEPEVQINVEASVRASLTKLRESVSSVIARSKRYYSIREGFQVLIAGPPNAGKSTLMNALAQRRVSIVSDMPGTTRDLVEVKVEVEGYPITFIDSAGLRETADKVEQEGVRIALERARSSNLVLWLFGKKEERAAPELGSEVVAVASKRDIEPLSEGAINISSVTGQGIDELLRFIIGRARDVIGEGEGGAILYARQQAAALRFAEALERAIFSLESGSSELCAFELVSAGEFLQAVESDISHEELLDNIFSQFCLGK